MEKERVSIRSAVHSSRITSIHANHIALKKFSSYYAEYDEMIEVKESGERVAPAVVSGIDTKY